MGGSECSAGDEVSLGYGFGWGVGVGVDGVQLEMGVCRMGGVVPYKQYPGNGGPWECWAATL